MSLLDVWVLFLVLGTLAVFAGGIAVLVRMARRHGDDDPRAMSKVALAVVFSVLLGAGSLYVLSDFQAKGVVGMHKTFTSALNLTVGDGDYWDAAKTIPKRTDTINNIILPGLVKINATLAAYVADHPESAGAIANNTKTGLPPSVAQNVTGRTDKLAALGAAYKDRHDAQVKMRQLTPNHALWLQVQPLIAAGRDAEAEELVTKAIDPVHVTEILPLNAETAANNQAPCERDPEGLCKTPLKAQGIEHSFFDAHLVRNIPVSEGGPAAFEHQREFLVQMDFQMKVFVYSCITGILMAPFAFAGGSILRRAFVPSDTVGFKPYPGKSAGWFLLLGAFGVFAIPFAAWTLRDLNKRSVEGQIAL